MQVAVERRPGSVAALTITVSPEQITERVEALFQKHARRINIPGFRPGKAPRHMLEQRLNPESLRMEAVEELIDITYKHVLIEQDFSPLERGEIEDLKMNDDGSVTFVVVVAVRPQVTLPEYGTLSVTHQTTEVTDEQVEGQIATFREHTAEYSEIEDDGVQTGDYVTVDYTMTVDGQPYPEGGATGYPLEVGSDTFFPQLNDALIDVKAFETATLAVDYADDYSNPDLAGKHAEFTISVQQVRRKVVPEASDAWAQVVTGGQAETLDDLRGLVRQNLERTAADSDKEAVRNELIRQLVDGAELELPEIMVEEEYEHLMHRLEHQLSDQYRMSLEDYATTTGNSVDEVQAQQRLMARDMVRRSLVLQEVARRENIAVTDDELNMLTRLAAMSSGQEQGELSKNALGRLRKELEKSGQLDHLASRLFQEKILSFLEGQAQITLTDTAPTEEPEAKPAKAAKKTKAAEPTADEDAAPAEPKPKAKKAPTKKKAVEGATPATGADEAPESVNTEGAD